MSKKPLLFILYMLNSRMLALAADLILWHLLVWARTAKPPKSFTALILPCGREALLSLSKIQRLIH